MKVAVIVAVAVVVMYVAWHYGRAIHRRRMWKLEKSAKWADHFHVGHNTTYVSVRKVASTRWSQIVFQEITVARIPISPRWSDELTAARLKAYDMAIDLNSRALTE